MTLKQLYKIWEINKNTKIKINTGKQVQQKWCLNQILPEEKT